MKWMRSSQWQLQTCLQKIEKDKRYLQIYPQTRYKINIIYDLYSPIGIASCIGELEIYPAADNYRES